MLALLTATLFFTAIIARKINTPQNSLNQSARLLEANLHKKEALVYDRIKTKEAFDKLKTLPTDEQYALQVINDITTKYRIWVVTTTNNEVNFWAGIKVIPVNTTSIKEGASFIKTSNGYYEVIKRSDGPFSVLFFISVKVNFMFENQYLKNAFEPDLLNDNNIEIADFTDKDVYTIHGTNDQYLFSVKINPAQINHRFFYFEVTFWVLALLSLCLLIHNISGYFARKGYTIFSITFLGVFIVAVRFVNLHYQFPDFTYRLDIFNPKIFEAGSVYPTLGDFCINILLLSWFASFLFKQRNRLVRKNPGTIVSYVTLVFCIIVLISALTALLWTFHGLIFNSQINFDVNHVLSLSTYSALGILMLCFSFLIFFLFTETCLTVSKRLNIPETTQVVIFIAAILLTTIIVATNWEFVSFYMLWTVIVLIRGYYYRYGKRKITSGLFATIILLYALIASIMINHFQTSKERKIRENLVLKLETSNDNVANALFKKIEGNIIQDPFVINSFDDTSTNAEFLKSRIQKLYFDSYLSKYDIKIHEFKNDGESITDDRSFNLTDFRDRVSLSSYKVSEYFYRENSSFGFQNYFAILPIKKGQQSLGVMVIDLKSKSLQVNQAFPELLVDGSIHEEDPFKNYSYAFYSDNRLMSQHGNYVYNLINTDFKGEFKKSVFTTTGVPNPDWYRPFASYSHLVYRSSDRNLIVLSRQENIVFYDIASLTFFFVVMLLFSIVVIILRWSWIRIKILSITDNRLKWTFKINFDRLLYKTRIQFSMMFAVVITLLAVALITYISISTQYQNQQDKMIRDKVNLITGSFEDGLVTKFMNSNSEQTQIEFERLAGSYGTDLNLFDSNGILLATTQPKIYESGLLMKRMNGRAFIFMKKLQRSEYVNDEKIGGFSYKAAYSPLRDNKGDVVAYLQLPYFSNEVDYQERIGSLLNIMFNIYALVFIAIGLFAVIIARQITAPLNFIQSSLSKIIYGKKNEPILWNRDDEIGALIKEYNRMIVALEDSAFKLAQSERESAWREMAKQVAHEIKNPLTPLKLGLQLLDKSWKDKDPKFDQKFERFSRSFVEQIESLSSIASEFSAFAKMPDTRLERINIFEMLTQAVTIFKQMDNVTINYQPAAEPFIIYADRDQLLRCFNNLLKNAIEATPEDRAGRIDIYYTIGSKSILLTLKDTGNGIPEAMREKIFEPNFTTKSSGTGLGLAFVKNSIENAGGKVWFETTIGIGTTFYLSLPGADLTA